MSATACPTLCLSSCLVACSTAGLLGHWSPGVGGRGPPLPLSTWPYFLYSCWLRVDNYFIWSFIGPVSFVIVVSWKAVPFLQANFVPAHPQSPQALENCGN